MIANEGEVAATANSQADAQSLQTPGALLQRERERLGLSIQQAADGLHLDPWIVEAMEANRFLALGAPVYAKGHLRKYAALLGLAPELILERYEALSDAPQEPTPVPLITTTPPARPKWPKYLGWALAAAVVLGLGTIAVRDLWPGADSLSASGQAVVAQQEAAPSASPIEIGEAQPAEPENREASASMPEAEAMPAVVDESASTDEQLASAPPVEPTPSESAAASAAAAADQVSLRLEFRDASWVEIHDATGQRLFYDIGQPGRVRTVTGTAPVTVVIGLVSAVSLQVNGSPLVVPRRANRDSTRFVVNADGSIR